MEGWNVTLSRSDEWHDFRIEDLGTRTTLSTPAVRRWTLAATIIGSSLTFIDATVINVALPALQADLHATITDVQWVIEAYALFLGGLILIGGALGDQFGRKRIFLAGVSLFTLASIACSLAGSIRTLIFARAVQGVGAAFLVPGSLAIISATFDDTMRGRAIGTWSGFSAIMSAIGPVAGGWMLDHVSWRAIFVINVPLAAVVIGLSWKFMAETRDPSRGSRVDYAGAALAVVGLGMLVFALLEWSGHMNSGALVPTAFIIGVLSLIALVIVEHRASTPMLPLGLFASRTFTLANVLTFLLYGALAVMLWLVPLNLIQVQRYSATSTGAALLPFPLLMFLLSRWSGSLVARVGSRLPLTIGPIIAAAGLTLFARTGIHGSYWTTFFPAVVVLALGMAILVAPLTTTAMNAVETQHAGVASGVNNAVARVAGLIAVAVAGILLARSFDARVSRALDGIELQAPARAAVARELPKLAGADVNDAVPSNHRDAVRQAIDESFVSAFSLIMYACAAASIAAGLAGALIR